MKVPLCTAALLSLVAAISPAHAAIAERVVAVVGDHAILLSDIRQRARPFLLQIRQRQPTGAAQQAAAESEMYKQLIERMVDERVELQAAEKARLAVTTEEIDAGLRNVANQQGISIEALIEEAVKTGLTP